MEVVHADLYDLRSLLSYEGRDGDPYDLRSLLSSKERDFLLRHNGDPYDLRRSLLSSKERDFLVRHNGDPYDLRSLLSSEGRDGDPYDLRSLLSSEGRDFPVRHNGGPYDLRSLLSSDGRDFLVRHNGDQVPISELEGKIVGLYFSVNSSPPCRNFTNNLIRVYQELKDEGASFEVVLISLDSDENSFKEQFQAMPWFALPFNDKACAKLLRYFKLNSLPTLVIIGTNGKTLNPNVAKLIENHGINAYPFSQEKLAELTEFEKWRLVSQTLESLLVTSERDFVIGGGGVKIPVSKLVGKTILLYFSAEWCGPCRAFLPKLIQAYNKIKAKGEAFEVIFISSDSDQVSFGKFFSEMPWLALPYGDATMKSLRRTFKIKGIPTLVAIGPDGRTVTTEARKLLTVHGSDAYPFTEHRLKELEALQEEEKKKKANEEEEEKKKNANEDGEKKNAKEDEENKNANEEDGEKKNDNEDEEQKKANEEDGKHGDHEQDGQKEGYVRVKLVLKLNFPMFFFLALLERRWGNLV